MKNVLILCAGMALLSSCAASKRQKAELANLQAAHEKTLADLNNCDKRTAELSATIKGKDAELGTKANQLADLQSQVDSHAVRDEDLVVFVAASHIRDAV